MKINSFVDCKKIIEVSLKEFNMSITILISKIEGLEK